MNTNISQRIMMLNHEQRKQLFSIIESNSKLLNDILPEIPLINLVAVGSDLSQSTDPVVQAYQKWKQGS